MTKKSELMKEVVCPECKSIEFVYKNVEETNNHFFLVEWVCIKCNTLIKTELMH